jgi:hypothetical protein
MNRVARTITENSVTIFLIVIGVIFIGAARTLPAPRFDPLGAGAFPTVLGWLMVGLGLLELSKSWWVEWRDRPAATGQRADYGQSLRACFVLLLTAMYGFSLAVLGIRFAFATIIYLMAASFILERANLRRSLVLAILFIVFAFTLEYLLKSVAYVDLP